MPVLEGYSTREAIAYWARECPGKAAIIDHGHIITYADFSDAIDQWAASFARAPRPIRKAAIVIPRHCNAWIASLALREIGAETIALSSVGQIAGLGLDDLDCVVCCEALDADTPLARLAPGPLGLIYPAEAGALPPGPRREQTSRAARPGGHVLYTSGTTGNYKRVLLDQAHEWERNRLRAEHYRLTADTVHHGLTFGLWTGIGYKHSSATWWRGGAVVFDARMVRFFEHGVTTACLTSAEIRALLAARKDDDPAPTPWRLVFGGGFMPLALARAARDRLGCEVDVALGATETAGGLLHAIFEQPEDLNWYQPYPDRTVFIVDEQGRPCPPNQEGEFAIPLMPFDAHEYIDDEAATARFFRNGCFYTGDLAVRRADGRVRILGRAEHVINLQGQKIAAAPIEAEIQIATAAREVCVFSGFELTGDEVVVIALEMDGPPPMKILDEAAARFGAFQRVRFYAQPRLPRGANGMQKIDRRTLRALLFPNESAPTAVRTTA